MHTNTSRSPSSLPSEGLTDAMTVENERLTVQAEVDAQLESADDREQIADLLADETDVAIAEAIRADWKGALPDLKALVAAVVDYRERFAAVTPIVNQGVQAIEDARLQAETQQYRAEDDVQHFGQEFMAAVPVDCRARILIERAIVRKAVTDILAAQVDNGAGMVPAYTIGVYDGEEVVLKGSRDQNRIMSEIMSQDQDALLVRRIHPDRPSTYVGSVTLIYGSDGWDVIAAHSVLLTERLASADRLASAIADAVLA